MKGITREVGQSVKWVLKMVKFGNSHLFFEIGLLEGPRTLYFLIVGVDLFGWNAFNELGVVVSFL
jgi:hypothetical protein